MKRGARKGCFKEFYTYIRVATLKHVFNIFFNIHQLTNCLVNKMLENCEKYSSNVPKMN